MDIHAIYARVSKLFRVKRMIKFEKLLHPNPEHVVLDVGGYPRTWTIRPQLSKRIDCLNVHSIDWDESKFPEHHIATLVGDGCGLDFPDDSYDILFSNSVIEHVGDWQKQQEFAQEVRRVGNMLWIQTPALACPIEPHYLAPFVHWCPVWLRRRLLRWFTPWGWIEKPSQAKIDKTIAFTRLLSKRQMRELFPDCEMITERLLWVFPKSYIAYRTSKKTALPESAQAASVSVEA